MVQVDGYDFYYSTDVKQQDVTKTQAKLEEAQAKGMLKSTVTRTDRERAGVALVISSQMRPFVKDVRQVSGRIISVTLSSYRSDITYTCCYAPHSGYESDSKSQFYDDLILHCDRVRGVHFLGGDMNARLHYRFHSEEDVLGPHVFGRGVDYLGTVADPTLENRLMFISFCKHRGLNVLNTFFRKRPCHQCTFRENTTVHGPEWTPTRYAQLDFWLADESFMRSCKDVQARTDIYFPSDRYIVEAVFAVKLSASNTHKKERVSKFRQPTNAEWHAYNQKLTELIQAEPTQEWKDIAKAIAQAAACSLTKLSHRHKRGYISRNTWDLIEKRQAAHEQGRNVEVIELNRNISVNAKKDRRNHVLDGLKEMPAQKEKWQGVRGLKSGFKPRFTQLKDIRGNFVPPKKRAECFAEYLEQKHWTSHSFSEVESFDDILSDRTLFSVDEFTAIEYDDALKNAKSNKQPGPDGLVMELFKWMNHTNRANILKHINKWWITAKAPPEIFLARVICIFKKGNTDDAANYRPFFC